MTLTTATGPAPGRGQVGAETAGADGEDVKSTRDNDDDDDDDDDVTGELL